jgi:prepilin-type N-terminal cleavage/methylation domain-containing protein
MSRGFSLLELLIATAISALLAAAIAAVVPPLQASFERTPAQIDLQQRGRTAIDTIAQAVRGADRVVLFDETQVEGRFNQLMTVAPAPNAARGVVAYDQLGAGGDLFLTPAPCPSAPDVCGFAPGSSAVIAGAGGGFDVFTVGSADAATRSLSPRRPFNQAYAADATIVEVDVYTFRLDPQADGSSTLVRQTASGAVQPIVDRVSVLRFAHTFDARGVGVELQLQAHGSTAAITRRIAIAARNVR